jgi:hypothetical protein
MLRKNTVSAALDDTRLDPQSSSSEFALLIIAIELRMMVSSVDRPSNLRKRVGCIAEITS